MRKFLIDANNLIHKHPKLSELFKKDKIAAQESLIVLMNDFLLNSKNQATLFFDGYESEHSFVLISNNLFVKYARKKTADEVIKSTIDFEKNKKLLFVVSSDSSVYNYAKICGCNVKSSEEFLTSLKRTAKKENQKFNPELSSGEIEEWIRIFSENKNKKV